MNLPIDKVKNPHIFFINGIGDHFLVLPTIRALSSIFKNRLSLICQKRSYAKFIFNEIIFKEIREIEIREDDNGKRRFDGRELSEKISDCDCLISLNPWGHSLDIMTLLNGLKKLKLSIGFYECFDITIPFNLDIHNIDLNFKIAESLESDLKLKDFSHPPLFDKKFQKIIKSSKPPSTKLLSIHFDTEKEKMWPKSKFIKLVNNLMTEYENLIVISLGIEKKGFINKLNYRNRVVEYEHLPFNVACSYVAESDFFIGIDSVFLHVADLYRIRGIGIFGPTSSVEFGYRFNKKHVHISPSIGTIKAVSVKEVELSFKKLL